MIFFHADDYGIEMGQAKTILECADNGVLNSLSVMPNSSCLAETTALLSGRDNIKKGIHINLCEGKCCGDPKKLKLITDRNGEFCRSFLSLLLLSILRPGKIKEELRHECLAQIKAVTSLLDTGYVLRLDSHRHYHMIPAVYRSLYEVTCENDMKVEYVRLPNEPIGIILGSGLKVPAINIVKALVLKVLSIFCRPTIKKWHGVRHGLFFGVLLTGNMNYDSVSKNINRYISLAKKRGLDLEVLFHPGGIDKKIDLGPLHVAYRDFYHSDNRLREKEALIRLKDDMSTAEDWQ